MVASRTVAKDTIAALVKSVTDAESVAHVVWEDTDADTVDQQPATLIPWVRVLIRHRSGGATSLPGAGGVKRNTKNGFCMVEIMTVPGDGNVTADALAQAFETAFEVRSNLNQVVWYTDVTSQEIGPSGGWYKTNVVAEFHYDIFQ